VHAAFAHFGEGDFLRVGILADKPRLDVGQPDIGPAIAADRNRVAAMVVGAVDQDAAKAGLRISAKVIFGRAVGHAAHHVQRLFAGAREFTDAFSWRGLRPVVACQK